MDYAHHIATQLNIRPAQVSSTIELLDADCSVPFIARYRKERTGGLDEVQLRQISESIRRLRALDERRKTVIKSIDGQGKLTTELYQQLLMADTQTELEDLYQPYKPRRRTRASIAREKGLQGLSDLIIAQVRSEQSLEEMAAPYLTELVPTVDDAWAGARDIAAETISDHPVVRRVTREKALKWGTLNCEKIKDAEDPRGVYQLYYEFTWRVNKLRPHQILAINRGEKEKVLRVKVFVPERDWRGAITSPFHVDPRSPLAGQFQISIADAAERLLLPTIERSVRRVLTEKAESHAINVFAANLRALLGQPPLEGRTLLGLDPGYRTGCKVAVVDHTGKLLDTSTITPHQPQKRWRSALEMLGSLVKQYDVSLIVIGNGTASRETEQLVAELIRSYPSVKYLIVDEVGASVYSASPLARNELPDLDVSLRGAVSIARRVQDPLAEMVKIDPRSIGVGMYQHDVNQKLLTETLNSVVESVVNTVGVDLNTASSALLRYVSGIGPKLAERIVAYRDERGTFPNRQALRKVPGLGPKAFEQAAGFLRIREGDNPLDASAIHPESYSVAEAVLSLAGLSAQTDSQERRESLADLSTRQSSEKLAADLDCGVPTLIDVIFQLVSPGRDPRKNLPAPILRSDVLKLKDLVNGMRLRGTVRNVVDFGAFVDIGVKQDGLLHRSQIPRGISLKVGDVIEVDILKVEPERNRISLAWLKT